MKQQFKTSQLVCKSDIHVAPVYITQRIMIVRSDHFYLVCVDSLRAFVGPTPFPMARRRLTIRSQLPTRKRACTQKIINAGPSASSCAAVRLWIRRVQESMALQIKATSHLTKFTRSGPYKACNKAYIYRLYI